MLPLFFTLVFLFALGIKLAISLYGLVVLAVLLAGLSWLQVGNTVFVLICLFIAAPFLNHWKTRKWAKSVFVLCVFLPYLFNLFFFVISL